MILRAAFLERLAACVLFVFVSMWSLHIQTPERVFGDAKQYWLVSQQFAAGQAKPRADGPFVFRVATPWLVAVISPTVYQVVPRWLDLLVDNTFGLDDVPPFYVVNLAAAFAALWLLQNYLRCFIASTGIRILLVAMWISQWHGLVRYAHFSPVNVEPLFLALLVAALLAIEKMRTRPAWQGALVLAPLVFAGTLTRESMLLVPVVYVVDQYQRFRRGIGLATAFLPMAAAVLALALTRQIGVATNAYSPWTEPLTMIRSKPAFTWVLAWFFAFGPPAIALIVSGRREIGRFLADRAPLAVLLAGCGFLAYAGGTDTERILGWAAPVVLVLVGIAIEARREALRSAPVLVGVLVLVHLASCRILWPIPVGDDVAVATASLGFGWASAWALLDKLLVIENYYANLWSFFGSRPLHAAILAFDVTFAIAIAIFIESRFARPVRQRPGMT